jgi:hypothetical protein
VRAVAAERTVLSGHETDSLRIDRTGAIAEVPPARWDALHGSRGLYTSHRFAASLERVEPLPEARVEILTAHAGGNPWGCCRSGPACQPTAGSMT